MQLDGKRIVHKAFGDGVITAVSGNILTANFPQGEKRFLYPDAFAQFLRFQDKAVQKQLDELLKKKKRELDAKKQARQAQIEREQRLRDLKVTHNSQAAFGLIHNDPQTVFDTWSVRTGTYLSGYSKGEPRVPTRLKPNSACLLTHCPKGTPEQERRILGVFLVREDFFGDLCRDGLVESHAQYRIRLSDTEPLLFWDYFTETDHLQRWGNTEFKYFANHTMQRILFDIQKAIAPSPRREAAEAFYRQFCTLNQLPDYTID